MTTTFLSNNLLRLRAVEPADAEFMWGVETDSTQWIENGMSAPYSRKNLRDYAETYDADPIRAGQIRFVIEDAQRRVPIGLADLYDISALCRTAFVGIYVTKAHRGCGVASEALKLLEEYARQLLNLRVIGAKVAGGNKTSTALFENSGYKMAGRLPEWLLYGNKTQDLVIYTKIL